MKQNAKQKLDDMVGFVLAKKLNRLSYKERTVLVARACGRSIADIAEQFQLSRQAIAYTELKAKAKMEGNASHKPRVSCKYVLDLSDQEKKALSSSRDIKKLILSTEKTHSYLKKALLQVLAAIMEDEEKLKVVDSYLNK